MMTVKFTMSQAGRATTVCLWEVSSEWVGEKNVIIPPKFPQQLSHSYRQPFIHSLVMRNFLLLFLLITSRFKLTFGWKLDLKWLQ